MFTKIKPNLCIQIIDDSTIKNPNMNGFYENQKRKRNNWQLDNMQKFYITQTFKNIKTIAKNI